MVFRADVVSAHCYFSPVPVLPKLVHVCACFIWSVLLHVDNFFNVLNGLNMYDLNMRFLLRESSVYALSDMERFLLGGYCRMTDASYSRFI